MQQVVRPDSGPAASVADAQPILLGLIGSPIRSSAAPDMHESAAGTLGLKVKYQLLDVPGLGLPGLGELLNDVRRAGFAGVNITFPYKQLAVRLVDQITPEALLIGTVNTITFQGLQIVATNTDATGFTTAFREVFGSPDGRPVALIGAGGVGRAIRYALAKLDVRDLRIFDADPDKAIKLAPGGSEGTRFCATVEEAVQGAGVVINATPVGMLPNTDCPVPVGLIREDMWVADAVYTPIWTPLLRAARDRGCRVMTGRELCIAQAVDAFREFTGRTPSREVMALAFDAVIARRDEPRDIYTPTTRE